MIHNLRKSCNNKNFSCNGFLGNLAYDDKIDYQKYKSDSETIISEERLAQMEILNILENRKE